MTDTQCETERQRYDSVDYNGPVHHYTEQQQRGAYRNNTAESMNTAILSVLPQSYFC